MNKRLLRYTVVGLSIVLPALSGEAAPIVASGSYGGFSWYGGSLIIGQTSTATAAGGGDPRYFAPLPQYSGVAALILNFASGDSFICSGSLLSDRRSILTAAHCTHPDATTGALLSTTAYFYGGSDPDTIVSTSPFSTAVPISAVFENPAYTGTSFIDQNDIAVLRLSTMAPSFAVAYGLSADTDLTGDGYNIAGYGARSDTGGSVGANLGNGRLRQGDNRYEYRMGDPDFAGGWANIFGGFPPSQIANVYLADFDNGLAANDTACLKLTDPIFPSGLTGPKYCDLGVGADEVGVAGGDSGGPQFDANGLITSITSFGMGFGTVYGDFDNDFNASWGEFNGFVPVSIHRDFIAAAMAPAPGALILVVLGLAGMSAVRRFPPSRGNRGETLTRR